tara:strand:+ start:437 stop:835 length:399 start_codon:yes stop_codon:yes gene_type:complete
MKKIYKAAKDSDAFVSIVPFEPPSKIRSRDYWIKIYGKAKHNLPHNFYFGAKGSNIVLIADRRMSAPTWVHYNFFPHLDIPIWRTYSYYKQAGWPYLNPDKKHPQPVSIERVMNCGPRKLKEFLIFNLDLFV